MTEQCQTQGADAGLTLLLVDGLNILRRCYEANPAPDSVEKAQRSTLNAFSSFRRALVEHTPTHALAAFDYGGVTWRHDAYSRYRENRKPMPEVLRAEIPSFRQMLTEKLGLATACVPLVEAEDVIATVFYKWLAKTSAPCIVISTDKDLAQLMADGALIRDHFVPEWRDAAWARAKFGVEPAQLGDFLALMGDSADDIPGIEGVGPKTAAKLLQEYGTLNAILENMAAIRGKVGECIRAQADSARLSRQLVELKADVSVGVTWNSLQYTGL
jgi:5'-3' exonuclease